ncbi:nitronate monooxygenase [Neoehrlichia mikurensis]|uniref:Nitronate monooxygenase n=1 Tax=Neoehrlichia mikurensis TaxID=89586 RepID=A0A9Q9F4S2_9RICK|nr:nitronate monooxygenase [Neoehrlichia mikurensis]QXK92362.1 nitronate monooxygenase [Neoehrlichia mikurensis]QXK93209.1 nitronate monooxygenase [Neoehrlichia mikurensis]QXK94056.1 nitronate monooxygenase [Neoehrlichia mikurensis]UTO55953.1 nitronate monooxygenase [Neoehrlichia mikurensis]UTO56869.1 nitronate monooxygenase [Neoehrlichia mikurensis]
MLSNLWKKGTEFLGSKYAIMGGAMSWVSDPYLVSAISNAGGFGVLACGAISPENLKSDIELTQRFTSYPFGVNLIIMHPQLNELIKICINNKITHIVLAGGIPNSILINQVKSAKIKIMCFAPSISVAKRLIRLGVDALIIEGMEAGGHIGPVSTSVLSQEILPYFKNNINTSPPIFVAGGIGIGDMIVHYLKMGASGCQIGTPFVCTYESRAHQNFKEVFIKSSSRDAIASIQLSRDFPVIPVRAISNAASVRFLELQKEIINLYNQKKISKEDGQLQIEKFWAGALKKAVIDGDIINGSLMAGQSVGLIKKIQSTQQVINNFVNEARSYIQCNELT